MSRLAKIFLMLAVVAGGSMLSPVAPAEAANANFKLTATYRDLAGKTIQWLTKTGRVLDSERITSNTQTITLTSSRAVSSVKQSSLQLINTSGGDYYGPVVLGWTSSTKVHTAVYFGTATSVNYGNVYKKPLAGTSVQGWAKTSTNAKKSTASKTRTMSSKVVKAVSYKPKGVGTYGKANTATASIPGVAEDSPLFRSLSIVTRSAIDVNDPANQYSGADPDGDGLPSFADVNDDGDAVIDAADPSTPQPPAPSPSASCESQATFSVFTNFKSTATNFAGNINAYGTGPFAITLGNPSEIVNALNNTLSMAIEKVTSVCGSNVVKWEVKGIGLPYAPSDYVDITSAASNHFDFQWAVGAGTVNGVDVVGLSEDPFTSATQISGQDAMMQRVTTADGKTWEYTSTAGFVFVSHPLPIEYKVVADGGDVEGTAWTSFYDNDGTATYGNIGIGATDTVYIKMYRPQRLAVLGELDGDGLPASFMDIGGFRYTPDMPNSIGGTQIGKCDVEMVSDSSFTDTAISLGTPPTITIAWKIGDCFTARSASWPSAGVTFDADMQVEPAGPGGNSAQKIAFITE